MPGFTIGEAAKHAGVKIDTLRFYERQGVIPEPSRTDSNYRVYPEDTVRRVRFVKHAQDLGFSLREIKNLLGATDQNCLPPDCGGSIITEPKVQVENSG